MNLVTDVNRSTRVTASGVTAINSGNNTALYAIMANSGTVGTINIYHGTTTGTSTSIIASGITLVTGVPIYPRVYGSGGIAVLVTGWTTPDITFYWQQMP